jgi:sterol desaturase/sphingolipid hydroxylase (fatty acid hydroxylase superfamily)
MSDALSSFSALAVGWPSRIPGFFEVSAKSTAGLAGRYFLFAGVAWLLGYVLFARRWQHRKIVPRLPAGSEVRREIFYSAVSVVIFGLVSAATVMAAKAGWTQLYWKRGDHGTAWFCGSIFCAVLLHDTWFYWTHRLMHHRKLFRYFHRTHHLSHNPSPWAAYAFDPAEAVVQAAIFPIAVTVIPMHPYAFVIFMFWQITFNIIGHTGYEFHPRWLMDSWLGRIVNTPTNHAQHHEKMRGNYGLYFNVWDRLMGTNHPDYESRFREVTTRPRPAPEP